MIPIFDLSQVKVAWFAIKAEGFVLYGFMLYTDSDSAITDFMSKQSGLAELDQLSGDECAIFVIESPSRKWVSYAKRHDHPWWRLFGSQMNQQPAGPRAGDEPPVRLRVAEAGRALLQNRDAVLVAVGGEEPVSLNHLLEPDYSALYDRNEIWEVVRHFGLRFHEIPCMVFFRDLDEGEIDVVCLKEIQTPHQATLTFREFFDSVDFRRMLEEARLNA